MNGLNQTMTDSDPGWHAPADTPASRGEKTPDEQCEMFRDWLHDIRGYLLPPPPCLRFLWFPMVPMVLIVFDGS